MRTSKVRFKLISCLFAVVDGAGTDLHFFYKNYE